jgi:hypothetical protein
MKKSLFGSLLVLAVAWSTVQAAAPTPSNVETGAREVQMWNRGLSVVPGNCAGPPGVIESTGFEAIDGWDSGFQICGSQYDDGDCIEPQTITSCVDTGYPGPTTQNCCGDFPNPDNCWFTSSASRSCGEPGISSANPFKGDNHLRLQADLSTGGSHQCFTPLQSISTPGNTHIEFMLNGSAGTGNELHFRAFDDSGGAVSGAVAVYMYFDTTGGTNNIYVYDYNRPSATRKTFVGYWAPGVYKKVEIDINPCRETGFSQVYKYDGVVIYSHSTAAFVSSVERSNWLFLPNTGTKTWDVDNYIITRGAACLPATCGDGFVDAPETCEPGVAGTCPAGRCIAAGLPGQCTCARICTLNDPCILNKGANGPYFGPFDALYGGIFLFEADAGATSINACGSTFDSRIFYWGSASDPADPGNGNDDCCDPTNAGCGSFGAGSDPSAPCYLPGDTGPFYPACTCHDLPDPADTLFLAQFGTPGSGAQLLIEITNKTECGAPILGGACCDGYTGLCSDGLSATACAAISDQTTYYPNKNCDIAPACIRHTGACCDLNPKADHCTAGTYPEDCEYKTGLTWVKGASCDPNPCGPVVLGACCNVKTALCEDNKLAGECTGEHALFSLDATCANTDCIAVTGACCDRDTFGGCTYTIQAQCTCPKCEWTKGKLCEDTCTLHDAIPTVSEWGIVVLTLLLLVGAKVYFGRRQNATA